VTPVQKPHKSIQVVSTPANFLLALQEHFGLISWDLAANRENRVVPSFLGPDSPVATDALAHVWSGLDGLLWLNPPFRRIAPWARKAALESTSGARIAFLVPLSSSNWARDWVFPYAQVFALNPRLRFDGHKTVFPKDLMLALYDRTAEPGFSVWQWDLPWGYAHPDPSARMALKDA
jgi:hypothetical protein